MFNLFLKNVVKSDAKVYKYNKVIGLINFF